MKKADWYLPFLVCCGWSKLHEPQLTNREETSDCRLHHRGHQDPCRSRRCSIPPPTRHQKGLNRIAGIHIRSGTDHFHTLWWISLISLLMWPFFKVTSTSLVDMSQEIKWMERARGQRCCLCPQHSPSEQHMLTMISKDVCWAVSKVTASRSSSLPLWTQTNSRMSQHPTKTMTFSTVITRSDFSCSPKRRNLFLQTHLNVSSCAFLSCNVATTCL